MADRRQIEDVLIKGVVDQAKKSGGFDDTLNFTNDEIRWQMTMATNMLGGGLRVCRN